MKIMKAYTDLEQSKKLAEILPPESADMSYGYIAPYEFSDRKYDGGYDIIPYYKDFSDRCSFFSAEEYDSELPCWSLAALLDVLPHTIKESCYLCFGKLIDNSAWYIAYGDDGPTDEIYITNENLIDACIEMIIKLKEKDLI